MKSEKLIVFLLAVLTLVSCGTKKRLAVSGEGLTESVPAWHTCLIQGAQATITTDEDRLSAAVTMQTVRDSMLVVSIMPLLGMEMLRLEATPTELIAIDKMHGRYAQTTYAELNKRLTPSLNWDVLQQLCSAELPTGPEKARLVYAFGDETVELIITYPPRKLDVPVRVTKQRLDKYTKVDVSKFL